MALDQSTSAAFPSNVGGTLKEVDASAVVDNVFIFESAGKKWERVFDGGNSVYRASWLFINGAPANKLSLLSTVIASAAIKTIEIDIPIQITGTIDISNKTLKFVDGGQITGNAVLQNAVIDADYNLHIFASTVNTNGIIGANGKVAFQWWGAAGDGVTNVLSLLTKALSTQTKTILMGRPGVTSVYSISYTGVYTTWAKGYSMEFLPDTRIKIENGSGRFQIGGQLIAPENQWIFEVAHRNQQFVVLESSGNPWMSVRWFGAKGDNSSDDTIAFQVASFAASNRWQGNINSRIPMYIPTGKYQADNISVIHDVFGDGEFSVIRAFTEGAYVFFLGNNSQAYDTGAWVYSSIKNMSINGRDMYNGFKWTNEDIVPDQNLQAGRWVIEQVTFNRCVTALWKPFGNIGNVYRDCSFSWGEYHYYCEENVNPVMHTGCDYFYNCHMRGATKASIYIRQSQNGGNHTFMNCVLEHNSGFHFFVKQYGHALAPISISRCYIEGGGTEPVVNIDGEDYIPDVCMYIRSARAVYVDKTIVKKIRAIEGSVVFVTDCNIYVDNATVDKSEDSVVIFDRCYGFTTNNRDNYHLSPPVSSPRDTAFARFNLGLPVTVAAPLAGTIMSMSGQQPTAGATLVSDGVLYPTCFEIAAGSPGSFTFGTSATIPENKYVVSYAAMKRVSGTEEAKILFSNTAAADFRTTSDKWEYFYNIRYSVGSGTYIEAYTGDVTYRIACIGCTWFDSYQEAYEFCYRKVFPSTEQPYSLAVGVGTGRTLIGGRDSGATLTLSSTSHVTKGKVKAGGNTALTVWENNSNVSIGQEIVNVGGFAATYRVLTISDTSSSGTVSHPVLEMVCTQRDGVSGADSTKILGLFDYYNSGNSVPTANRLAGRVLVRADGATLNNRGGKFEIWLKANGTSGLNLYFDIDNTGKLHIFTAPNTGATTDSILVRDSATGEVKSLAISSLVDTGVINTLGYFDANGGAVKPLTAITASSALVSDANGLPVAATTTATEIGYVNGVTSSIQTQLNSKLTAITGSYSANGDGVEDTFTITHGFGGTPSQVLVTPTGVDTAIPFYVTNKTSTTFDVVFPTPPIVGTDNVIFDWLVK